MQDSSSSGMYAASIHLENTQNAEPTVQPAFRMTPRPLQYRYHIAWSDTCTTELLLIICTLLETMLAALCF